MGRGNSAFTLATFALGAAFIVSLFSVAPQGVNQFQWSAMALPAMALALLLLIFETLRGAGKEDIGRAAGLRPLALLAIFLLQFAITLYVNSKIQPPVESVWLARIAFDSPKFCFEHYFLGNAAWDGPYHPYFAGIFLATFGGVALPIRLAGAVLSSMTLFLLYLIAKKLHGAGPASWALVFLALAMIAFNPRRYMAATVMGLQNAFSAAFILLLLHWLEEGRPRQAFALGAVAGLGFGTKPFFLSLMEASLPAVLLFGGLGKRLVSGKRRAILTLAAGFSLGCLTYLAYNAANGFPTYRAMAWALDPRNSPAMGYAPLDILSNLPVRIGHLMERSRLNGWGGMMFPLVAFLSVLHFAAARARHKKGNFALIVAIAISFLAVSTISYHAVDNSDLGAGDFIFYVIWSYPVAALAAAAADGGRRYRGILAALALALAAMAVASILHVANSPGAAATAPSQVSSGPVYLQTCPSAAMAEAFLGEGNVSFRRVNSAGDYARILENEGPSTVIFESAGKDLCGSLSCVVWGWAGESADTDGLLGRFREEALARGRDIAETDNGYYRQVAVLGRR